MNALRTDKNYLERKSCVFYGRKLVNKSHEKYVKKKTKIITIILTKSHNPMCQVPTEEFKIIYSVPQGKAAEVW